MGMCQCFMAELIDLLIIILVCGKTYNNIQENGDVKIDYSENKHN